MKEYQLFILELHFFYPINHHGRTGGGKSTKSGKRVRGILKLAAWKRVYRWCYRRMKSQGLQGSLGENVWFLPAVWLWASPRNLFKSIWSHVSKDRCGFPCLKSSWAQASSIFLKAVRLLPPRSGCPAPTDKVSYSSCLDFQKHLGMLVVF